MVITYGIVDPTTEHLPPYHVTLDDMTGQSYLIQVHAENGADATQRARAFLATQRITVREVCSVEPAS